MSRQMRSAIETTPFGCLLQLILLVLFLGSFFFFALVVAPHVPSGPVPPKHPGQSM
jgi:hypothetical protein